MALASMLAGQPLAENSCLGMIGMIDVRAVAWVGRTWRPLLGVRTMDLRKVVRTLEVDLQEMSSRLEPLLWGSRWVRSSASCD